MNEFVLVIIMLSLGGYGIIICIHLFRMQKHYAYNQWRIKNYYNMRMLKSIGLDGWDKWNKIDAEAKKKLGITEY